VCIKISESSESKPKHIWKIHMDHELLARSNSLDQYSFFIKQITQLVETFLASFFIIWKKKWITPYELITEAGPQWPALESGDEQMSRNSPGRKYIFSPHHQSKQVSPISSQHGIPKWHFMPASRSRSVT
jgi:hypothetical protein